jgi:hypothetical protein
LAIEKGSKEGLTNERRRRRIRINRLFDILRGIHLQQAISRNPNQRMAADGDIEPNLYGFLNGRFISTRCIPADSFYYRNIAS